MGSGRSIRGTITYSETSVRVSRSALPCEPADCLDRWLKAGDVHLLVVDVREEGDFVYLIYEPPERLA